MLTKAERRRRGRAVRASLRQYDLWQDPAVTGAHPDKDATEQRWSWLLRARAELGQLIEMERAADPAKWAAWAARRAERS